MNNVFGSLSRFWLFKNWTNFSIFTLFTGSTSYFVIRYNVEKQFEHPVFEEALRLAECNTQIVDLIGFPILLHSNARSRITTNDHIVNSLFQIRGPKGYLETEIAAQSKTQGEIQHDIKRASTEQITPEARAARFEELDGFYIPDAKLLALTDQTRLENKENLGKTEIPQDSLLWKLDYLYVNVDRNFRIVLYPKPKTNEAPILPVINAEDSQATLDTFKPKRDRKTLEDITSENQLRKRKSIEDMNGTEEEIEELRKFKLNEMNRKISYVRFYMFAVFAGLGMSAYVYVQKNRRKNLMGSVLYHQAVEQIKRSAYVQTTLGKKFRLGTQIRGAAIGEDAEFELDVIGDTKFGVFKVKGDYKKNKADWDVKDIELIIKDQRGREIEKKKIF